MTWEKRRLSVVLWSQGITSRPLFNWIPLPGPVAYQVHSGFFTCAVISTGALHDAPLSELRVIHTVRSRGPVWRSVTFPGLLVNRSRIAPVFLSTTGVGLP